MTTSYLFSKRIAGIVAMERRLQWLLVNQRAVLDHNTLWADTKTDRYARLVDGFASPLARNGRKLQAICFQFEVECHLVVIHRGLRLCFVLPAGSGTLDKIASAAMELLQGCEEAIHQVAGLDFDPVEEAPPGPEVVEAEVDHDLAWREFRGFLLEVIGKILSRPQAERLIARELTVLGITGPPVAGDFERIGRDVVAHVPHRGKQAALLAEVLHFLES